MDDAGRSNGPEKRPENREERVIVVVSCERVEVHDGMTTLPHEARPLLNEDRFPASPLSIEYDDGVVFEVGYHVGEPFPGFFGPEGVVFLEAVFIADDELWWRESHEVASVS